jgi:filamentous hemagglutinin
MISDHIVHQKLRICVRWWFAGVFAIPRTGCFQNDWKRLAHHADHMADFGNCTCARYEQMADRFLGGSLQPGVLHCTRASCGDLIRYNPTTEEFGILRADGIIKTYFKPTPCWSLPAVYASKPGCHGHIDNMTYFHVECGK